MHGLSLVVGEQGLLSSCGAQVCHYSGFYCCGAWTLGMRASVVAACGFSSCGLQALGTWAQSFWHLDLTALQHVGSSRTRDQTSIPCIARQILNH